MILEIFSPDNCNIWGGGDASSVKDKLMGIRVAPEVETEGLDLHEMGAPGYHDLTPPSSIAIAS